MSRAFQLIESTDSMIKKHRYPWTHESIVPASKDLPITAVGTCRFFELALVRILPMIYLAGFSVAYSSNNIIIENIHTCIGN